jgi:hypothetical protein
MYNEQIYEYDSLSNLYYAFRDELQPIYEPMWGGDYDITQPGFNEIVCGKGWLMIFHSETQVKTFIDGITKMRTYDLRPTEVF